jgi:hypothetical protein
MKKLKKPRQSSLYERKDSAMPDVFLSILKLIFAAL